MVAGDSTGCGCLSGYVPSHSIIWRHLRAESSRFVLFLALGRRVLPSPPRRPTGYATTDSETYPYAMTLDVSSSHQFTSGGTTKQGRGRVAGFQQTRFSSCRRQGGNLIKNNLAAVNLKLRHRCSGDTPAGSTVVIQSHAKECVRGDRPEICRRSNASRRRPDDRRQTLT